MHLGCDELTLHPLSKCRSSKNHNPQGLLSYRGLNQLCQSSNNTLKFYSDNNKRTTLVVIPLMSTKEKRQKGSCFTCASGTHFSLHPCYVDAAIVLSAKERPTPVAVIAHSGPSSSPLTGSWASSAKHIGSHKHLDKPLLLPFVFLLLFHHLLLSGWGTWMDGWRNEWMERMTGQTNT